MQIVHSIAECRAFVQAARKLGQSIGFVPTMGALHEGHLSLMRRAREDCDTVVASVFVNPTQFGPRGDLARYPRNLERDAELAESVGVDLIFAPANAEMYPEGFTTCVTQQGQAVKSLEGQFRPGHFRGVLTVCLKLFHVVTPHRAYFGRKDYQQALLVTRMVRDLDLPIQIVVCETVRGPDGLALSSRNQYLAPLARNQAKCINRGLGRARAALAKGERSAIELADLIRREIVAAGPCEIDYIAIADPETLAPVETLDKPAVALVAVRIGETRLIDNCTLEP